VLKHRKTFIVMLIGEPDQLQLDLPFLQRWL
jgi:hypothetical protein